jgi:hypothetical protein
MATVTALPYDYFADKATAKKALPSFFPVTDIATFQKQEPLHFGKLNLRTLLPALLIFALPVMACGGTSQVNPAGGGQAAPAQNLQEEPIIVSVQPGDTGRAVLQKAAQQAFGIPLDGIKADSIIANNPGILGEGCFHPDGTQLGWNADGTPNIVESCKVNRAALRQALQ